MTALQLFQWITDNHPTPYEVRKLYAQLSRAITRDEAWWVCYVVDVRCTGPNGGGYPLFVKELMKQGIFLPV